MAPAVERFFARGAGPRMMNIVLSGTKRRSGSIFQGSLAAQVGSDDLLLYSLEVTGAAGYWIEFSRALIRGKISPRTLAMSEVYPHAMEAARVRMREGMLASEVHKAAADIFSKAGFSLGHLTGHSIGMTMIEYPAIGANTQIELKKTWWSVFIRKWSIKTPSLPLHARHLPRRQERRRVPRERSVALLHRPGARKTA